MVEHTKGCRERLVRLVPDAIAILQNIEHRGEYIFMRNGERITSRRIAYILRKYAKDSQCIVKSSHKIRKTYVSRLAMGDVPVDDIRKEMGHQDLETTYGYIFNPLTEEETYACKEKSLNY
ncbi:tyrosine-type recombinase/integrase [Lacrimispora sp. BS-2]|uniref:Tyrosine-type recombinase/integrase n=1 Tax=Lacrimispora sp. BS-2 TaxID=3151850 RepID=A0AAU7PV56_9FIRM